MNTTTSANATVTKVRFLGANRRFHGIGTCVVLADGWKMTFIGPMAKGQAITQAEWHRARGEKSE